MNATRTERTAVLACGVTRHDAKERIARAWDRAIRALGYSNEDVAKAIGVSESRVRKQRSDDPQDLDVVPNLVDLVLLDTALAARFFAEVASERKALHGESIRSTVEHAVSRAIIASCQFSATGAAALADSIVEPGERPQLESAGAEARQALDDLTALFRTTDAKALIR